MNESDEVAAFRVDAQAGDAEAQFNLGVMYDRGQGVPQDDVQAAEWYRKAAEQGHAAAQNNLLAVSVSFGSRMMELTGWQRLSVVAMTVCTLLVYVFLWGQADPSMALLFWLTLPLLVFLLQWATRWIYRGFRGE
jgi:TPR repeat protein